MQQLVAHPKTGKAMFFLTLMIVLSLPLALFVNTENFGYQPTRENYEPALSLVKNNIRKDDIFISDAPSIAEVYFRAPDYFIKQKRVAGVWGEWPFDIDPYSGRYMVDSIAKIKRFMGNKEKRLWIFTKINFARSPRSELTLFIQRNFDVVFAASDNNAKVYLWECKNNKT